MHSMIVDLSVDRSTEAEDAQNTECVTSTESVEVYKK